VANGDLDGVSRARTELGYVDFLRANYARAERWLDQVLTRGSAAPATRAKAAIYLGSVASDLADYPRAITLLEEATTECRVAGEHRRVAYGLSMSGRIALLQGDLERAAARLQESIELAERDHWLSFLPWPQALLGHVHLRNEDLEGASACLEQSFARACQIGDPCWEGISARGLALLGEASGEVDRAVTDLVEARARATRLADPYVWLDVFILDALCEIGTRHGHPWTATWVDEMHERASRAGMRELTVRAMLHAARMGSRGDAEAAVILAGAIENPELERLVLAASVVARRGPLS
jgi:tetratricopeptide (TPR) repeat protein